MATSGVLAATARHPPFLAFGGGEGMIFKNEESGFQKVLLRIEPNDVVIWDLQDFSKLIECGGDCHVHRGFVTVPKLEAVHGDLIILYPQVEMPRLKRVVGKIVIRAEGTKLPSLKEVGKGIECPPEWMPSSCWPLLVAEKPPVAEAGSLWLAREAWSGRFKW
jgi:hypothetical protein